MRLLLCALLVSVVCGVGCDAGVPESQSALRLSVSAATEECGSFNCLELHEVMSAGVLRFDPDSENDETIFIKRITWTYVGTAPITDIDFVTVFGDAFPFGVSQKVEFDDQGKAIFDINLALPVGFFTVIGPILGFNQGVVGGDYRVVVKPGDIEVEEGEVVGLPIDHLSCSPLGLQCN